MLTTILGIIIAYLMGSIPSGVWVSNIFCHKDITKYGSGNTGTTNVFRVLGPKAGIIVFAMDVLKGAIPTLLPSLLFNSTVHPIIFGIFAILGHALPIYNKFKGGKAVATSCGVALAIYPVFLLILVGFFALILYTSSMVSLASVSGIGLAFVLSFFLHDTIFTIAVGFIFLFVVYRHKDNIKRIINGNESRVPFGLRSSKNNKL